VSVRGASAEVEAQPRGAASARLSRVYLELAKDTLSMQTTKEEDVPLAIAGTGYGIIGILVIILLAVLILYFVRRV
jgi:hypothetical protein